MSNNQLFLFAVLCIIIALAPLFVGISQREAMQACQQKHSLETCQHSINR